MERNVTNLTLGLQMIRSEVQHWSARRPMPKHHKLQKLRQMVNHRQCHRLDPGKAMGHGAPGRQVAISGPDAVLLSTSVNQLHCSL